MPAGLRRGDEAVGHRGEGDAHAAGGRSGDAGERGHGDRLVDQNSGNGLQPFGDDEEAGQRRDDCAEAVLRRGIGGGEQCAGDRGLASLGEALLERPEGERHDGEDAEQKRAFHRPDRRH